MKHYIVTITTNYSEEDYLVPAEENEDIELATNKVLSNVCFCDDWNLFAYKEVSEEYLKSLEDVKEKYLNITGQSVEEAFTNGEYTTYEDIVSDLLIELERQNECFKAKEKTMAMHETMISSSKLIEQFKYMANRGTLLCGQNVQQEDLLIQIIGTIVKVAME